MQAQATIDWFAVQEELAGQAQAAGAESAEEAGQPRQGF